MQGRAMLGVAVMVLAACGGEEFPSGSGGGSGGGFPGTGGGSGAATCSAQNCSGCCFNGSCQPGSTAAGCGKAGAACVACNVSQVCRVDQTCGVDPESTWLVQPVTASIAANNNGSTWDGDGSAPDPRVYMTCPGVTPNATSTGEASNTYQPNWSSGGCTAKAKDLLRSGWTFVVYDIDAVSDDSITAQLVVPLVEQDFTLRGFSLQPTGGLQSMTVSLTRQ